MRLIYKTNLINAVIVIRVRITAVAERFHAITHKILTD